MTRKQARRRKQKKPQRITLPKIRLSHIVAPVVAVTAVVATYLASASMLDRPIRSIEISGPFQRVTALQIEEAIAEAFSRHNGSFESINTLFKKIEELYTKVYGDND